MIVSATCHLTVCRIPGQKLPTHNPSSVFHSPRLSLGAMHDEVCPEVVVKNNQIEMCVHQDTLERTLTLFKPYHLKFRRIYHCVLLHWCAQQGLPVGASPTVPASSNIAGSPFLLAWQPVQKQGPEGSGSRPPMQPSASGNFNDLFQRQQQQRQTDQQGRLNPPLPSRLFGTSGSGLMKNSDWNSLLHAPKPLQRDYQQQHLHPHLGMGDHGRGLLSGGELQQQKNQQLPSQQLELRQQQQPAKGDWTRSGFGTGPRMGQVRAHGVVQSDGEASYSTAPVFCSQVRRPWLKMLCFVLCLHVVQVTSCNLMSFFTSIKYLIWLVLTPLCLSIWATWSAKHEMVYIPYMLSISQ